MTQTPNESTDVHADEVTTRPHQRTNRQYTPTACNAQSGYHSAPANIIYLIGVIGCGSTYFVTSDETGRQLRTYRVAADHRSQQLRPHRSSLVVRRAGDAGFYGVEDEHGVEATDVGVVFEQMVVEVS